MHLPFEPELLGIKVNLHLILEYLAFFLGYQYYLYLRKSRLDVISRQNRLSIILGAAIGALVGSRIMGFLEYPFGDVQKMTFLTLLNTKTIMGGLFGGLLGVEIAKKIIEEQKSSGDLFTLPIIMGIFIGRIGCFLSGTNEFTYGKETKYWMGMDLGDGIHRHPLVIYEMVFLLVIFFLLRHMLRQKSKPSGTIFKYFMISYFGFRFFIEFLKPNAFFILGLSSIQWLCLFCLLYYWNTLYSLFNKKGHAYTKI